jgi:hypothetical protein
MDDVSVALLMLIACVATIFYTMLCKRMDRYNIYCNAYGCFYGSYKDDAENPPPMNMCGSMPYPYRVFGPNNDTLNNSMCGPFGCGGPSPYSGGPTNLLGRPVWALYFGAREAE